MKTSKLINCSFFFFYLFLFSWEIDVISTFSYNNNNTYFSLLQGVNGTDTQKESKNPVVQSKPLDEKMVKEYADKAKMMTQIFLKTIKNIKQVLNKIIKSVELQKKVNNTVTKFYNKTKGFNNKLLINQIRNDMLLSKINKNLMAHIKNQFYSTIRLLKDEIIEKEFKIELLDMKISKLKMRLPMSESICSQYLSCTTCVKDNNCGWCGMTQTCMEGNKDGVKGGSCMFFDYGVCSGKKDCDYYSDCKSCIKDPACGWCNKPGKPSCLNVEDVNNEKCREDLFYHLHKSLSICPHISLNTYKSKIIKDLEEDRFDINLNVDVKTKTIDPEELKHINKELGIFEKRRLNEEIQLKLLMNGLNATYKSIDELEKDDYIFHHYYYKKDVNIRIMHETVLKMYKLVKDFVIDYRVYKLNKRLKKTKKKKRQKVYKVLSDGTILEDNKAINSMQKIMNLNKETKIDFKSMFKLKNETEISEVTTKKSSVTKVITKKTVDKKANNNKKSKDNKRRIKSNKKANYIIKNSTRNNISKHNSTHINKSSSEIKGLIKEYEIEKNFTNKSKNKRKCNLGKGKSKPILIKSDPEDESNSIYQTLKKYFNWILHPSSSTTEKKVDLNKKTEEKLKPPSNQIKIKICVNKTENNNSTKNTTENFNNTIKLKSLNNISNSSNTIFGIHNDIDEYKNENGYDNLRKYENNQGVNKQN